MMRAFDRLAVLAMLLAAVVVTLGAYVRLSDAGLGCPDWPGCYGQMTVPQDVDVAAAYPGQPLEAPKAWKEMVHRYFAGTLGLLVLSLFLLAWRHRHEGAPAGFCGVLLGLVLFQAALGMWTVTLLLKPAIVAAHLMGGMATLGALVWLAWRRHGGDLFAGGLPAGLRFWVRAGLALLALQILLGGWTSANYAALACNGFPLCQGAWLPDMDFAQAFHPLRALGETAAGGALSPEALVAIQWTHRVGALVTFLILGWLALRLLLARATAGRGLLLAGLLLLQVGLGMANVLLGLPLATAVAHNAVAALLLVLMVILNSGAQPGREESNDYH